MQQEVGMVMGVLISGTSLFGAETVLSRNAKPFPNALPGKTVVIEKVFDEQANKITVRSDYPGIADADGLAALENAEREATRKKFGSLDAHLISRIQDIPENEKRWYEVSVRQKPGVMHPLKDMHSEEDLKAHSLTVANLRPEKSVKSVLADHGIAAPPPNPMRTSALSS